MEDLDISEETTEMSYKYTRVCKMDIYWLRVGTKGGILRIRNKIWGLIKRKIIH